MADDADLRLCCQYCKIDMDDEDDVRLTSVLMSAAYIYLLEIGIEDNACQHELYQLALWGLVLHWHDGGEAVGGTDQLPAGTRAIINSLKNAPHRSGEVAQ